MPTNEAELPAQRRLEECAEPEIKADFEFAS